MKQKYLIFISNFEKDLWIFLYLLTNSFLQTRKRYCKNCQLGKIENAPIETVLYKITMRSKSVD